MILMHLLKCFPTTKNNDLETLSTLPFYHQDPFDRMIIAQSKTKNLNIISTDSQVQMYFM